MALFYSMLHGRQTHTSQIVEEETAEETADVDGRTIINNNTLNHYNNITWLIIVHLEHTWHQINGINTVGCIAK